MLAAIGGFAVGGIVGALFAMPIVGAIKAIYLDMRGLRSLGEEESEAEQRAREEHEREEHEREERNADEDGGTGADDSGFLKRVRAWLRERRTRETVPVERAPVDARR
jgi:hypothetical protein